MKEWLKYAGAIAATLSIIGIGYKTVAQPNLDQRYAQVDTIQKMNQRIDLHIKMDSLRWYKEQLSELECKRNKTVEDRRNIIRYQTEIDSLKSEIEGGK